MAALTPGTLEQRVGFLWGLRQRLRGAFFRLLRKVADTVVFLFKGEAIYFGPVADLEKSEHPHVKQFLAMDRVEVAGKIEEV